MHVIAADWADVRRAARVAVARPRPGTTKIQDDDLDVDDFFDDDEEDDLEDGFDDDDLDDDFDDDLDDDDEDDVGVEDDDDDDL